MQYISNSCVFQPKGDVSNTNDNWVKIGSDFVSSFREENKLEGVFSLDSS